MTLEKTLYDVVVPYEGGRTIKGLLATSSFHFVSPEVNDVNFPQEKCGPERLQIELLSLSGRAMSSDELRLEMTQQGLRPANMAELLSLGALDDQSTYQHRAIVALGQALKWPLGLVRDPIMSCRNFRRKDIVFGGCLRFKWRGAWRFAAVRT